MTRNCESDCELEPSFNVDGGHKLMHTPPSSRYTRHAYSFGVRGLLGGGLEVALQLRHLLVAACIATGAGASSLEHLLQPARASLQRNERGQKARGEVSRAKQGASVRTRAMQPHVAPVRANDDSHRQR